MHGFIVIDKPAGKSSHDIVSAVRKICNTRKVGHTGTLDPFATGVLPIAIGEGTKAIQFLDESVKMYQAEMRLGIATDTQDYTGRIINETDSINVSESDIALVMAQFIGPVTQIPPMFSALKRDGVPLYRLARAGKEVEREPRQIMIHEMIINSINLPFVSFTVSCSPGTYVRTIAADIGDKLACGAHLTSLRRIRSGTFSLESSLSLEDLQAYADNNRLDEVIVSPFSALSHMSQISLNEAGRKHVEHGISPALEEVIEGPVADNISGRLRLTWKNQLLAVAETYSRPDEGDGLTLRLLRVFNSLCPLHDEGVMLKTRI